MIKLINYFIFSNCHNVFFVLFLKDWKESFWDVFFLTSSFFTPLSPWTRRIRNEEILIKKVGTRREQKVLCFNFGSAGFNDFLNWDDDKYLTLKSPHYFGIYFKTAVIVVDIIISKFSFQIPFKLKTIYI